jgi:hypothetical protein
VSSCRLVGPIKAVAKALHLNAMIA